MPLSLSDILAKARAEAALRHRPRRAESSERAEYEWAEVYQFDHYLARFWHQRCTHCQSCQTGLEGLYEVRKHPRLAQTIARRLTGESLQHLRPGARATEVASSTVDACLYCAKDLGVDAQAALASIEPHKELQ